jgi:hypothetical protein
VTGAKIAAGLFTDGDVAPDALTAASLAANSVGADELANGAVDGAAIQSGAVTSAKVADGALRYVDLDPTDPGWLLSGFTDGLRAGALSVAGNTISGASGIDVLIDSDADDPDGGTTAAFEVRHATNTGTQGLFRVRENGNLEQLGTTLAGSQVFDLAEYFPTDQQDLEPGDVVSARRGAVPGLVARADVPMDPAVVGVVTTSPAIILGGAFSDETYFGEMTAAAERLEREGDAHGARVLREQIALEVASLPRVAVALAGRVPVKVTTENGPIEVGDLLTASSTPGRAMRFVPGQREPDGVIIGKALQSLHAGSGTVLMLVVAQ